MKNSARDFKRARSFFALACLTAALLGCSGGSRRDAHLSTFRYVQYDDVKNMDPGLAYDSISWDVLPLIYESLFQYSYLDDPYKVVPLIAADLPSYSKDRKTVTIRIRRGIHFQDDPAFPGGKGREVTAQDFIYQFKRLALPATNSQGSWVFEDKVEGFKEFRARLIGKKKEEAQLIFKVGVPGFVAVDSHTLEIHLLKPYPQLLNVLCTPFTAPMAAEVVAKYGDEQGIVGDHPVGTGPFVLKEWRRSSRITLDRNPTYHPEFYPTEGHARYRDQGLLADAGKTLPFLDRIVFQIVKETQPAWLGFLKGDYDVTLIPKDVYSQAIQNKTELAPDLVAKGIQLSVDQNEVMWFISFNMRDPLVGKNKYLRQALASAIDRKKYIELFTNNRGIEQTHVLPPGIEGRPENPKYKFGYDLARAKALLAKAGYPGGKKLPELVFDMRGSNSTNRQIAEYIAHQWSQIGVKTKVVLNTFPGFLEKKTQGNLQTSFGGWHLDYPDAENAFQVLYGPNQSPGPNEPNFDHPEFNKLFEKMASMTPGPARSAVIQKMEDIVQEESPWAYLYYPMLYTLAQGNVKNYRASELIINRFKYLRMEKAGATAGH
ncbi:MAG: ABC transporter substrate-binding protein [Bacteriovoracia bacterium]